MVSDDDDDGTDPGRSKSGIRMARIVTGADGMTEITGDPVAIDEARRAIEEGERRERVRKQLWGEPGPGRMVRLCALFPSLRGKPGTDPWNADDFIEWLSGPAPTSGSRHAAMFVLGVWNPTTDWSEVAREQLPRRQCNGCDGLGRVDEDGRGVRSGGARCRGCDGEGTYQPTVPAKFDYYGAMSSWDPDHVAAFLKWTEYPFWP